MSLRIWLPLNGNLNNQGLDDIIITNSNAIIENEGKIGKCYSFNGFNSRISLTGEALYRIIQGGEQPFSISFWIYRNDTTRGIIFGDHRLPGGISFNIELYAETGIRWYWNNSPDYNTQINFSANTWNHVTFTYDGNYLKSYLNGLLINSREGELTTLTKTEGAFYLGRDNRTGNTALNGKINDFRIYDHCLSHKEIKVLAQGLIYHYPLNNNDINRNIVYDISGYCRNGIINGTISSSNNTSRYNNSTSFGLGNNYININLTNFYPIEEITISVWIKPSTWGTPLSCGGWCFEEENNDIRFSVYTSNEEFKYVNSGITSANLIDNNWHLLTGTVDSTSINFYIDGILKGTVSKNNNENINYNLQDSLFIKPLSSSYVGEISDIRIYSTALSAKDILELYNISTSIDNYGNLLTNELIEN